MCMMTYCEGCEIDADLLIHPLSSRGYCANCARIACSRGLGDRVGLPTVPVDRLEDAIVKARQMLDEEGDTLIMGLSTTACDECDDDWFGVDDEDHIVVTLPGGDYVLIGCEGYHDPALRAAALML